MVRKAASEGPSLFCEWAVGSTIDSAVRKIQRERFERENEEARRKRDVIKVELTTDDESETDSVRVTYPRKGTNGGAKGATKKPSGTKQVRFENEPLKPALKKKTRGKRRDGSSGSDTLVTESESGTDSRSVDTTTSGPSDSEADSTDTSSFRRHKSRKSRRSKGASSEDSDAIFDSGCSDCGRDLTRQKAKERKSRSRYTSDGESSGSEKGRRAKKDEKHGHSKARSSRSSGSHNDGPIDVDLDPDVSEDEGKSRRRKESYKHKTKGTSPKDKVRSSSRDRKPALSSKQKVYPEAMPGSHPRRPNLIRPIRAEVMQVEHTVEGPEDPRPNAFVDERNNVVRVYHGPAYGNPFGKLYPRRDPSQRPLPVGVPHPLDNPYYHGFRASQQRDHLLSPTGHMPTTLGVNYSSIPATAGPGPQAQASNLTSGLWGLEDGTKAKASSWTNNIGPPTPSASSLRKANPTSRWDFAAPNKGVTRDFSGGSKKGGDGNANDDWRKIGNWDTDGNVAANDWGNDNTGDAGNNQSPQKHTNDQTGGNNNSWNNGGNNNTWDTQNNGNNETWDNSGNDNSWDAQNNGNSNSWNNGGNNDTGSWGANNTTWDAGAQDNGSSQSASNNVGFIPGTGAGSPPGGGSQNDNVGSQGWPGGGRNHVPGAWGAEGFPDWGDATAAQSTWK